MNTPIDLITGAVSASLDSVSHDENRRSLRRETRRSRNSNVSLPGSQAIVNQILSALSSGNISIGETKISCTLLHTAPTIKATSSELIASYGDSLVARLSNDRVDARARFANHHDFVIRHPRNNSDVLKFVPLFNGEKLNLPNGANIWFPGKNVVPSVSYSERIESIATFSWLPYGKVSQGKTADLRAIIITASRIEVDIEWKLLGFDFAKNVILDVLP